jgi:hypothetical protein
MRPLPNPYPYLVTVLSEGKGCIPCEVWAFQYLKPAQDKAREMAAKSTVKFVTIDQRLFHYDCQEYRP